MWGGAIQVLRNTMRVGGCQISREMRYEGVQFNVSSVTRGWAGVNFHETKRYATLEWPLDNYTHMAWASISRRFGKSK